MMNNIPQVLLAFFSIIILTSCSSSEDTLEHLETPTEVSSKPIENEILNLINEYRVDNGLSVLQQLNVIKSQTHNHTNYMVSKSAVSHDNFYQRKEYLTTNADAKSVAENVAYGYTTAISVVNAWLNSDGHKKNIEGDYNYFEVSAEKDVNGKWYYTNIFIKK